MCADEAGRAGYEDGGGGGGVATRGFGHALLPVGAAPGSVGAWGCGWGGRGRRGEDEEEEDEGEEDGGPQREF